MLNRASVAFPDRLRWRWLGCSLVPRAAARRPTRRRRGRRRWCRSRRSRRATFRSRCAPPSICGRWCRRTSGRRRSAIWTPCWSIAATTSRGASCWRWCAPAICRISWRPRAARWRRRSRRRRWRAPNYDRAKQLAPEAVVSQQELQQAQSQFATAEAAAADGAGADRRAGGAPGRDAHRVAADGRGRAAPPRSRDAGRPAGRRRDRDRRARRHAARVHHRQRARAGRRRASVSDAHVELDALPGQTFSGKVVRLAPTLDPATRTLDAEVQLDNRAGELYPGMYGRGAIVVETHPQMPVVPGGRPWC